jgi:hypothetical protein
VPPRVIAQLSDTAEIEAKVLAALSNLTAHALAPKFRSVHIMPGFIRSAFRIRSAMGTAVRT